MLKKRRYKICGKWFMPYNNSQVTCGDVECWAVNNEARKKRDKLNARRYKKFNTSLKKAATK